MRSLRLRLLAGFGLVIALSLFLSGSASVLLLRDQQVEAAEQRIGRLVDPLACRQDTIERANRIPSCYLPQLCSITFGPLG